MGIEPTACDLRIRRRQSRALPSLTPPPYVIGAHGRRAYRRFSPFHPMFADFGRQNGGRNQEDGELGPTQTRTFKILPGELLVVEPEERL